MRRRRRVRENGAGHLNVTPMIDVVMCLIIFYLLVGQLASQQRSQLVLPRSSSGDPEADAAGVFLNVRTEGPNLTIDADGVPLDRGELPSVLRGVRVVHLRADAALPYAALAPVLADLRDAGVDAVRVATERTGSPTGPRLRVAP
ncbi:MAG: biopolymer transporter ExbD [Planctomycetota bacterium]